MIRVESQESPLSIPGSVGKRPSRALSLKACFESEKWKAAKHRFADVKGNVILSH